MTIQNAAEVSLISIALTASREDTQALMNVSVPAVRLQTMDLARHVATDPKGHCFVVATFDDSHIGRGYVTAVYPQQNGYLTLVRLMVCEFLATTPEQAAQRHAAVIDAIQKGKLKAYMKANKA